MHKRILPEDISSHTGNGDKEVEVVSQWMCYLIALGMRMVHVLVSYEDEVVVSQWMCYLNAFGYQNGTCIGYEDEVAVTQWVFPFDCLRA